MVSPPFATYKVATHINNPLTYLSSLLDAPITLIGTEISLKRLMAAFRTVTRCFACSLRKDRIRDDLSSDVREASNFFAFELENPANSSQALSKETRVS